MLTKEMILQAKDWKVEKVNVPEWGGDVYLREMSMASRDKWEVLIIKIAPDDKDGKEEPAALENFINFRAKLVQMCLCDKDGTLLFSEEDIDLLASKSPQVINRLYDKAWEMSMLGDEGKVDAAKN